MSPMTNYHLIRLWACSSVVEHVSYKDKVGGSIPPMPTYITLIDKRKNKVHNKEVKSYAEYGQLAQAAGRSEFWSIPPKAG